HHRDLHSFPTRRSSDLAETVPSRATVSPDCTSPDLTLERGKCFAHHIEEFWSIQYLQLLLGIVEIIDIDHGETKIVAAALDLIVDRKSTRLNSSHSQIS